MIYYSSLSLVLAVGIGLHIYRKLSPIIAITLSYFIARPLLDYAWPRIQVTGISPVMEYALQRQSLFMVAMVLAILAIGLSDVPFTYLRRLATYIGVGNGVYMAVGYALNMAVRMGRLDWEIGDYGLLGNSAQDACLVLLCIPFATSRLSQAFMVASVIAAKSAAAFLGLMVLFLYEAPVFAMAMGIIFSIALYMTDRMYWHDNGRLGKWSEVWGWLMQGDWLFGWGPGSYWVYGPSATLAKNIEMYEVWTWVHNDWLEIAYGYGLLGFWLAVVLFGYSLYLTKYDKRYWVFLITLAVVMCFQMPMSQPWYWLIVGIFVRGVCESENIYVLEQRDWRGRRV